MDRRTFLKLSAGAGVAVLFQTVVFGCGDPSTRRIRLPSLPYPADALEPYISKQTVLLHHGRHHRGYVEKTVELASHRRYADRTLAEIVTASAADAAAVDLFNAAAQAWNHRFYWNSMKPGGGGPPVGAMAAHLADRFGSYEAFVDRFVAEAVNLFGSGWIWLVQNRDGIDILSTANAATPLTGRVRPLLTVDLWEHAYYLDYADRRDDYVRAVLAHLVNWEFAEENVSA